MAEAVNPGDFCKLRSDDEQAIGLVVGLSHNTYDDGSVDEYVLVAPLTTVLMDKNDVGPIGKPLDPLHPSVTGGAAQTATGIAPAPAPVPAPVMVMPAPAPGTFVPPVIVPPEVVPAVRGPGTDIPPEVMALLTPEQLAALQGR